jgi:hypothetical protein
MQRSCFVCLLAVLWVCGCQKSEPKIPVPSDQFPTFYPVAELPIGEVIDPVEGNPDQFVTLSVKEMPLTEFLRVLAAQHNVSVIWSDALDKRLVSVEAVDVPVREIFDGLARRFGCAVERVGSSWYVGESRNADKVTLVRKARRLSQEDISTTLQTILGDSGRSKAFRDGLVIVYDRADAVRRIALVLDEIENARADSWVVQLYLFSTSKAATKDLGIDTSALIDLSYAFAQNSLLPGPSGNQLAAKFSAVMRATASREDVRLIGKPLFVLGDGETSSFISGVSVPVPKKTVSDQGTVTTSGYEYVQSGLTAETSIREGGKGLVTLKLRVALGQVTGYVEEAPVQAKDEFTTTAVLASSGVYLLGALDQDQSRASASGIMDAALLNKKSDKREIQIQIWARLYRIGGPLK